MIKKRFIKLDETLLSLKKEINDNKEKNKRIKGIPSKFNDLDKYIFGFQKDHLIVLGGRPAMGKTTLALNFMINVGLQGKSVAFFSMENDVSQITRRILSIVSEIKNFDLINYKLDDDDLKKIDKAYMKLKDKKIFIYDAVKLTIEDIIKKCREMKNSDNVLDLVIIDYLQLINTKNTFDNREEEINMISHALKLTAIELHIPVIILSELSRSIDSRNNKEPLLSDFNESSSIINAADIIMLLYRSSYYNRTRVMDTLEFTKLIIAKNANREVGTIYLRFKQEYGTYSNYLIGVSNGETKNN